MWRLVQIVCLVVLTTPPASSQDRDWTSTQSGRFRAKFVRELDGEAVFLKDGRLVTIPLDELSEVDRKLIGQLADPKESGNESPATEPDPDEPPKTASTSPVKQLVKPKTPVVSRDWADVYGFHQSGRFVRIFERDVVIMRGARTFTIPFDTLSPADKDYVNQILTERGSQPISDPPARPAPAWSQPGDLPPAGTPLLAPGEQDNLEPAQGSQFYEELRQRQEKIRQEQAEFEQNSLGAKGESNTPPMSTPEAAPHTNQTTAPAEPAPSSDQPAKNRTSGVTLRIDPEMIHEMRGALVIAGVMIGLLAVIGVIIFIATSIAGSNTPRGQRRYY